MCVCFFPSYWQKESLEISPNWGPKGKGVKAVNVNQVFPVPSPMLEAVEWEQKMKSLSGRSERLS